MRWRKVRREWLGVAYGAISVRFALGVSKRTEPVVAQKTFQAWIFEKFVLLLVKLFVA
jgi:hypothetical protein